MCGRYSLTKTKNLEKRYSAIKDPVFIFSDNDNIRPMSVNPVILQKGKTIILPMYWGLIPSWSKDFKMSPGLINARSETVFEKRMFSSLITTKRCLIPVTGFYEWQNLSLEKKEEKVPWVFKHEKEDIFSLAGIYDKWEGPEGDVIFSYSIITTDANSLISKIHPRMPVVIEKENENKYLDINLSREEILNLLKPLNSKSMKGLPYSFSNT